MDGRAAVAPRRQCIDLVNEHDAARVLLCVLKHGAQLGLGLAVVRTRELGPVDREHVRTERASNGACERCLARAWRPVQEDAARRREAIVLEELGAREWELDECADCSDLRIESAERAVRGMVDLGVVSGGRDEEARLPRDHDEWSVAGRALDRRGVRRPLERDDECLPDDDGAEIDGKIVEDGLEEGECGGGACRHGDAERVCGRVSVRRDYAHACARLEVRAGGEHVRH